MMRCVAVSRNEFTLAYLTVNELYSMLHVKYGNVVNSSCCLLLVSTDFVFNGTRNEYVLKKKRSVVVIVKKAKTT
jgi:dTDP-4-dehydrorhamnose reductase